MDRSRQNKPEDLPTTVDSGLDTDRGRRGIPIGFADTWVVIEPDDLRPGDEAAVRTVVERDAETAEALRNEGYGKRLNSAVCQEVNLNMKDEFLRMLKEPEAHPARCCDSAVAGKRENGLVSATMGFYDSVGIRVK